MADINSENAHVVSYTAFESACSRLERSNRRVFVLCLILIAALIATNVGWVLYESQYQAVEVTQEVGQEADGDGSNQFVGGDFYSPTEVPREYRN